LAELQFAYAGDDLSCIDGMGVLLSGDNTPINFNQPWVSGRWQLTSDDYYFARSANCRNELRNVSLELSVSDGLGTPVVDSSGVNLGTSGIKLGEEVDIRYGRLVVQNTNGPINTSLPMPAAIQYWDGEAFTFNDWHPSEAVTNLGGISQETIGLLPADIGGTSPTLIDGSLDLTDSILIEGETAWTIGGDVAGSAEVMFDLNDDVANWLGYCWRVDDVSLDESISDSCNDPVNDYQQSPSAVATFGSSTGSDNIILIREMF
jgi:hypothetical protein